MIIFEGKTYLVKGKKRAIKETIKKICIDHSFLIDQISYVFISDDELLQINRDSLNHDYYTDIITFDYSEKNKIETEIYISYDRVKDNAIKFNTEFHVELLRVIFHGILHCVGYKDKNKEQKAIMRKMEDKYINLHNSSTWNK